MSFHKNGTFLPSILKRWGFVCMKPVSCNFYLMLYISGARRLVLCWWYLWSLSRYWPTYPGQFLIYMRSTRHTRITLSCPASCWWTCLTSSSSYPPPSMSSSSLSRSAHVVNQEGKTKAMLSLSALVIRFALLNVSIECFNCATTY